MIDHGQERALRRFFVQRIVPIATDDPATRPPSTGGSYYVRPERGRLGKADFELPLGTPEEIAATLDARWAGTTLAGLGRRLVDLSRRFPEVAEKDEVSSYIYEMF